MRGRRLRCLPAAVLLTATLVACGTDGGGAGQGLGGAGTGTPGATEPPGTYLALGDSVPFGYIARYPGGYEDEDVFRGYPELIGQDRALTVVNAACPGETAASLIDGGAPSNGCTNVRGQGQGFRALYPLHVDYDGSQLDHAVRVLRTTDDVELVTLQVGVNDTFLCRDAGACGDAAGLAALAERVRVDVDTILAALRDTGYAGRIVVVTYSSPDYADPLASYGTEVLNAGIAAAAEAHGADVASGYDAFRPLAEAEGGSSVAAGLLHRDAVHPTDEGHRVLADEVQHVLGS